MPALPRVCALTLVLLSTCLAAIPFRANAQNAKPELSPSLWLLRAIRARRGTLSILGAARLHGHVLSEEWSGHCSAGAQIGGVEIANSMERVRMRVHQCLAISDNDATKTQTVTLGGIGSDVQITGSGNERNSDGRTKRNLSPIDCSCGRLHGAGDLHLHEFAAICLVQFQSLERNDRNNSRNFTVTMRTSQQQSAALIQQSPPQASVATTAAWLFSCCCHSGP